MFSWDWLFLVPELLLRGRQGGIFSVTFSLNLAIPLHLVQKEKRGSKLEEDDLFYPWHKRFPYFVGRVGSGEWLSPVHYGPSAGKNWWSAKHFSISLMPVDFMSVPECFTR